MRPMEFAPPRSPNRVLGLSQRALTFEEAVAWRQDWHRRSVHPTCAKGRRTISDIAP